MSAINRLDEIQARAEAATEGPWHEGQGMSFVRARMVYDMTTVDQVTTSHVLADVTRNHDAEFIAHARTDIPALVAALRAVLAACNTYEATQGIYRIEMGQREIIRVVRAEIEAALKEGDQS